MINEVRLGSLIITLHVGKVKLMKVVLGLQLLAVLFLAFTSYVKLHSAVYSVASSSAYLRELKDHADLQPREDGMESYRFTDLEFAEFSFHVSQAGANSASMLLIVAVIGSVVTACEIFLLSRIQRRYIQSSGSTANAVTSFHVGQESE